MYPADLIFFWARANPEHPALIQPDMIVTYRELAAAIDTVSQRLAHYGFAKGEPVAVSIPQPIQKLAVCLALMRSGISVALVGRSALPHLRAHGIYNVIFTGEGLMLSGGRNIRFEDSWLRRGENSSVGVFSTGESLAAQAQTIFLAPGAVGGLKKTIVPSGALMARMKRLPLIGEANYNRALIVPSLNSPGGFCRAAVNLYAGRTACFAADDAARLLTINTFNIDTLVCTPAEANALVDFVAESNTQSVDRLRAVWIEDAYLPRDLGRRMQLHLCREIIAGYGSPETGRVALANFNMLANLPDAVGFVVPHAEVEIVGDGDVPVKPGELGRVRCRTEFYSELCAANNAAGGDNAELWWHSGDVGRLRSDGMLSIVAS